MLQDILRKSRVSSSARHVLNEKEGMGAGRRIKRFHCLSSTLSPSTISLQHHVCPHSEQQLSKTLQQMISAREIISERARDNNNNNNVTVSESIIISKIYNFYGNFFKKHNCDTLSSLILKRPLSRNNQREESWICWKHQTSLWLIDSTKEGQTRLYKFHIHTIVCIQGIITVIIIKKTS